jgi:hypothetical protein
VSIAHKVVCSGTMNLIYAFLARYGIKRLGQDEVSQGFVLQTTDTSSGGSGGDDRVNGQGGGEVSDSRWMSGLMFGRIVSDCVRDCVRDCVCD